MAIVAPPALDAPILEWALWYGLVLVPCQISIDDSMAR
jgi:hypothetical protein